MGLRIEQAYNGGRSGDTPFVRRNKFDDYDTELASHANPESLAAPSAPIHHKQRQGREPTHALPDFKVTHQQQTFRRNYCDIYRVKVASNAETTANV